MLHSLNIFSFRPPGTPWTRLATLINLLSRFDTRQVEISNNQLAGTDIIFHRFSIWNSLFICFISRVGKQTKTNSNRLRSCQTARRCHSLRFHAADAQHPRAALHAEIIRHGKNSIIIFLSLLRKNNQKKEEKKIYIYSHDTTITTTPLTCCCCTQVQIFVHFLFYFKFSGYANAQFFIRVEKCFFFFSPNVVKTKK